MIALIDMTFSQRTLLCYIQQTGKVPHGELEEALVLAERGLVVRSNGRWIVKGTLRAGEG